MAFIPLVRPGFHGWEFPGVLNHGWAQNSFLTLDADGEKVLFAGYAPKTGTLDGVILAIYDVTQTPANGLKVSFQDLTTVGGVTGCPDGTADEYRVVAGASLSASTTVYTGIMSSDGTDTGTKRTVTQGDPLGVVLEFASFAEGDDIDIWRTYTYGEKSWCYLYTGGAWNPQQLFAAACVLVYSDGTYAKFDNYFTHIRPVITTTTVTSATTPDELGIKFQIPVSAELYGISWCGAAQNDLSIKLYNAADTVLSTGAVNLSTGIETYNSIRTVYGVFPAPIELAADTTYRVTLLPGASNIGVLNTTYSSAAHLQGDILTNNYVMTSRTDAGSWTDETTKVVAISLMFNSIDTGSGSSSGGTKIMPVPYYRF